MPDVVEVFGMAKRSFVLVENVNQLSLEPDQDALKRSTLEVLC